MQYVSKSILFFVCVVVTASGAVMPPDGWRFAIPVIEWSDDQFDPDIACKGDSVFVAWIDTRSFRDHIRFKSSVNKGFSFGSESSVLDIADNAHSDLRLAIDIIDATNGWTYLLWTSKHLSENRYYLKFARSSNRGANWYSAQVIASDLTMEPHGSIFVDDIGHIHIAYYEYVNSEIHRLKYTKSTDHGATWTSPHETVNARGSGLDIGHSAFY